MVVYSKKPIPGIHSIDYKSSYDTYDDSPIEEFFVPSLNASDVYDRAVGFFSSAILTVLSEAFTNFSERGGKMNLICSPILSSGDAQVFEELSREQIIDNLNTDINSLDDDGIVDKPLNLMAALIRSGCLSVKFAIPYDPSAGIFHQKIGLFTDSEGGRVAFSGSSNESISGWLDGHNSESFNVFTSWRDENDLDRVDDVHRKFEKLWRNQYNGFDILDFTDSLDFIEKRSTEDADISEIKSDIRAWYQERKEQKKGSEDRSLYPYQKDAIVNWINNDYLGIICFATGAGKTRTAIGAIDHWRAAINKRAVIILVPSERLQKQWLKELRENPSTKNTDILLVGGGGSVDRWSKALRDVTEYKRHEDDGIVIAVMNSASTEAFYDRINWGNHLLVVADEVHNLGAPSYVDFLSKMNCGAILGLSATPERYNDDENELIRDVFGEDLKPIVDIPYAQELGVLVPYRYRFETVTLDEEEVEKYNKYSRLLGQASSEGEGSGSKDRITRITEIAAQRANVLKNAVQKVEISSNLLKREFRSGQSWIVFCNDIAQLEELKESIKDLKPLTYFGEMEGDADATLRYFEEYGGVLLSIHQLDEGVDIPSIDHCLLIASSQSKRQFVQRRGRVLRANRKNPKGSAEIWDLIVVDDIGKAFVNAEVIRAMEFGTMALNRTIVTDLEKLKQVSDIVF
jgi:superfamily II DNA or RNA helicase